MAGSRRNHIIPDQWRPEERGLDRHDFRPSHKVPRARPRSFSRERARGRRHSLSPPRDTDTYRPKPKSRKHRPAPATRPRRSRSPVREPPREPAWDKRRSSGGHYSPGRQYQRLPSPGGRRSPDSYFPNARHRSPISSTYRPRRTPSPRNYYRRRSPVQPIPKRKTSESPPRLVRQARLERPDIPRPSVEVSVEAAKPAQRQSPPHRLSRRERRKRAARSRDRRRREDREIVVKQQDRKEEGRSQENMSYPYHHGYRGRGGSRAPPPPQYDPAYGSSTPFMSAHQNSASASPYTPRGGNYGYGSYHGSPQYAYPSHPPPHRQNSYPPAGSSHYYNHSGSHGGSPHYGPPHGYPPPHSSYDSPPPRRGSHSSQSDRRHSTEGRGGGERRGKRGMFQNLSWTPSTGNRGGVQLPPKNRTSSRDPSEKGDDDDNNPFRPSKDLQSEDQGFRDSKRDKEHDDMPPPKAESKISFAIQAKASSPPTNSPVADRAKDLDTSMSPTNVPKERSPQSEKKDPPAFGKRKREPQKVLKRFERIKPKPKLDPEHASSDSVYFRRPGNESVVGSGTYGKVFKAIHVYTKEKVALKKIRMEGERDGFPVTAIREVKLLQSLNNDNIVKLQEVMVERNDCYMVFEYLSHDLTGLLNHPTFRLTHAHKKHLAQQLFEGLDYLHRKGVLHRDIKAANILISSSGQLKFADFGLARFYVKRRQLDYTNRVITIWYRSPELLLGETQYGPAVDIWSAACVLVEIFTKHAIFPGDGGEISQLDRIYNVLGTPTLETWPDMKELAWFELLRPAISKESTFQEKYGDKVTEQAFSLLQSMFVYDPRIRPTAQEVLSHPYFKSEEPLPKRATELGDLEGDWHEFESKALRKEKERQEREERRKLREVEERKRRQSEVDAEKEREAKRVKVDDDEAMTAPP